MHLTYTNQIIFCMCSIGMDVGEIASRSAAKLAYTLKKKEQLDAVVGFVGVYNFPH